MSYIYFRISIWKPNLTALSSILLKALTTITNNKEGRGSPYLSPPKLLKILIFFSLDDEKNITSTKRHPKTKRKRTGYNRKEDSVPDFGTRSSTTPWSSISLPLVNSPFNVHDDSPFVLKILLDLHQPLNHNRKAWPHDDETHILTRNLCLSPKLIWYNK